MTTIAYRRVARYITTHGGDFRAHHILSTIGSMLANSWKKQGAPTVHPRVFSPWGPWPEEDADGGGSGLVDPYGDPILTDD